ncbi:MAG: response regulator [Deltaproteobacteria bacterium]|nr:response regulator [Deltaproteobacteria bacterium]
MAQTRKKILTVDDDPAVLLSISGYLEDLEYEVYTATNGQEGLSRFYEISPDMVLVDLKMPIMSGTALIEKIRQFSPNKPILVISGANAVSDAMDAIRMGAWDYLAKPLSDLRLLQHTISKAFEKERLILENERYQQNLETQIIGHSEKLIRANAALQTSEEKYRTYIEQSPDGIVVLNPTGFLVEVNSAFTRLTGYSKAELLEMEPHITREFAKKHWGHLHSHMHKLLDSEQSTDELIFLRKDGILAWLGFTAAKMPGGEMLGFFRDITSQKVAEKEALKRQETQQMQKDLAAWLSVCPSLSAAAEDVLGQITWLDEVDCASLFLVVGENQLDLVAQQNVLPEFWEEISHHVIAFLQRHLGEYMDAVYFGPNGVEQYMGKTAVDCGIHSAGIIPLRYGGEIEAVICIASKSSGSFLDSTKDVVESVAALTAVAITRLMAEQELRNAILHAEDANRLKSRFVSNVSHELRTPLNGIIGFSEFIMAAKSLDEAQDNARTIVRESEVLLRLINGLLDHAKMEEGKLELNPEIVDLHALLDDIARTSFLQARRKGLDFDLQLGKGVPKYIVADALRLRQILNNLVSNALKFTDRGIIHLIARVDAQHNSNCSMYFAVKDTGIGIPKERQKAIFDSFVQADSGTARKYGGSGLGTTISLQLVKLMNGEMGLESEESKGSTFWFTISFPTPAIADAEAKIKSSLVKMLRPIDVAAGTILLAEDYPINQKVIGNHLEQEGFHFRIVESGKEAVDACEDEVYSLILMDVNMPVMDGVEATQLIRTQSTHNRKTPILALTASAEPETRDACLKAGMNDVITKPVKRDFFLGAVYKWFSPVTLDENGIGIVHLANNIAERNDSASEIDTLMDTESQPAPSQPHSLSDQTDAPLVLDEKTLMEQFAGNRVLAQTMIDHFKQAVPKQLAQMQTALSNNNLEQVRKEAHKIKGGAGSIAAFVIMEAARQLEYAARDGMQNDAMALLAELTSKYQQFKEIQL